jgi:hypothetical protein
MPAESIFLEIAGKQLASRESINQHCPKALSLYSDPPNPLPEPFVLVGDYDPG